MTARIVGEKHSGGFAQKTRAKADWLVKKPDGLSLRQIMAIGTAGFTAMLCVMALATAVPKGQVRGRTVIDVNA